ncbi:hypothetical protein ACWDA3_55935 [Nonomuraea rubra]
MGGWVQAASSLNGAEPRQASSTYRGPRRAKATRVSEFWNAEGIPAPFNEVIPKGEIGLNIAWPAGARVWTADVSQGRLHPTKERTLTLVPRLSNLRDTALGRARFALPDSDHRRRH